MLESVVEKFDKVSHKLLLNKLDDYGVRRLCYSKACVPRVSGRPQHSIWKWHSTKTNAWQWDLRKKLLSRTQYTPDCQPLKQVAHILDLRTTASSDLSWSNKNEVAAAKANKTLALVTRICREIDDYLLNYAFLLKKIVKIHSDLKFGKPNSTTSWGRFANFENFARRNVEWFWQLC